MFAEDLAAGKPLAGRAPGLPTAAAELDLGRTARVAIARLEEDIEQGQVVARYALSGSDGGAWREFARGQTIGYRKLDRFEPTSVRRVRLVIEDAVVEPRPIRIGLYEGHAAQCRSNFWRLLPLRRMSSCGDDHPRSATRP